MEQSIKQREQLDEYKGYTLEPTDQPEPLPEGAQVFVGEDQIKMLEEQNKQKIQLPSMPQGIMDWNEQEQKNLMYSAQENADMEDIVKRMQFKLSWIWQDWDALRNNERLIEAVNNVANDKESEEHFIKQILVLIIDRLGKVLGQTPIVEELTYKK